MKTIYVTKITVESYNQFVSMGYTIIFVSSKWMS